MVSVYVTPQSVAASQKYLNDVQMRIFEAVRDQVGIETQTLADTAAEHLQGNPITQHTGRLLAALMRSPRVVDTTAKVIGSVGAKEGALNLGLWLEEGHRFPKQRQKLLERSFKRNIRKQLARERLQALREQGGSVPAYPFLIPALREREAPFMENIRRRIADATAS